MLDRWRFAKVVVVLGALQLAGCKAVDIPDDEFEANNSVERAKEVGALQEGGTITLDKLVLLPNDFDCFVVGPLPPMRRIEATLTRREGGEEEEGSVSMQLFAGSEAISQGPTKQQAWDNTRILGSVTIKVEGQIDDPALYALTIADRGEIPDDGHEEQENDTPARAVSVSGGLQADLMAKDPDWFKVAVPDLFQLVVKVRSGERGGLVQFAAGGGRALHEEHMIKSELEKTITLDAGEDSVLIGVYPAGGRPFPYELETKVVPPDVRKLVSDLDTQRKRDGASAGKPLAERLLRCLGAPEVASSIEAVEIGRSLMVVGRCLLNAGEIESGREAYTLAKRYGDSGAERQLQEIAGCSEVIDAYRSFLQARDAFDRYAGTKDRAFLQEARQGCQATRQKQLNPALERELQRLEGDLELQ